MNIIRNIVFAIRLSQSSSAEQEKGALGTICSGMRGCLNLLILEAIHGIYGRVES